MFEAWGRWVYVHRVATLWVSLCLLLMSVLVLSRGGRLTTGLVHGTESEIAARHIDRELPLAGVNGFTVVFSSPSQSVYDPEFRRQVEAALAPLRRDPDVIRVKTAWDPGLSPLESATMMSLDEHHGLALVALSPEAAENTALFPAIRAKIRAPRLRVTVTGVGAFRSDLDRVLERDLLRAELYSAPITLLVLLLVFGSLLASVLPVGVGGLSVLGGVACILALSRYTDIAQYAINVASLVGLGVAIDYSLFIVSRFREELARDPSVENALARTLSTAGRAVAFSGLAVAIGLMGLLFFRGSYLVSLGLGGTLVVTLSVLYALTFLPALLAVLGPRINHGRFSLPLPDTTRGLWRAMALWVMKYPLRVLLPTVAVLCALGRPFFDVKLAIPDLGVLPASTETRRGDALLREHFAERTFTRVVMVVRFPTAPLATRERIGGLYDLSRRVALIPGVQRVESLVDLDPSLRREALQDLLTSPESYTEAHIIAREQSVGERVVVLSALSENPAQSEEARGIVRAIRSERRCADGELRVTGQTAIDIDNTAFMRERAPRAVGFVIAMTVMVLFALLGSVVLPFKAVAMNLLSITASFGSLVWIFQQGHLQTWLRFTPGPIDPSLPIVLFCATFGLSMDYEVLMLTRMQEEYVRTGDNTRAVAEGLERSAKLITSAAAIMVVVFAAFATAEIVVLKIMGVAMAIAVTLDATLVRMLVVPATMRLFGDLNWWAPEFLLRIQRRIAGRGH